MKSKSKLLALAKFGFYLNIAIGLGTLAMAGAVTGMTIDKVYKIVKKLKK